MAILATYIKKKIESLSRFLHTKERYAVFRSHSGWAGKQRAPAVS